MGRLPSRLPVYPFGDNEKLQFGIGADYSIYYDGTNFLIDSGTHSLEIDLDTAGYCKLYMGDATADYGVIYANSVDARPNIKLHGTGDIELDLHDAQKFKIHNSGTTFFTVDWNTNIWKTWCATGTALLHSSFTGTTTGNLVRVDIDASTGVTAGTNFGVTGLKINVAAPNGSGLSYGIDLSSLAVDFPVFKVVSDALASGVGALAGQIAIDVAGTTYYIPYYAHGS